MKTLLIYHESDEIDREVTVRWLASFSKLAGLVVLRESSGRMRSRVEREIKRVGPIRFIDVVAFRVFYKLFLSSRDNRTKDRIVESFDEVFPVVNNPPKIFAGSPNSPEVRDFILAAKPDIVIARCKTLLTAEIFTIARDGTFVLHPGICPEYRNAHGCFWALAREDHGKVGLTLLRIDKGIDTGPVYGYFSYAHNALEESHIIIQNRVFTENLDQLQKAIEAIHDGSARPINVAGRLSKTWGQPWLSAYLRIRRNCRRTAVNGSTKSRHSRGNI